MDQRGAKVLVSLDKAKVIELIGASFITCLYTADIIANWEHIKEFAKVGEYQHKFTHGWNTYTELQFNAHPSCYRAVPTKEINWLKAMKNGAYGETFEFSDKKDLTFADNVTTGALLGYFPEEAFSFSLEDDCFKYCNVPKSFYIPASWYD